MCTSIGDGMTVKLAKQIQNKPAGASRTYTAGKLIQVFPSLMLGETANGTQAQIIDLGMTQSTGEGRYQVTRTVSRFEQKSGVGNPKQLYFKNKAEAVKEAKKWLKRGE